MGQQADDVEAGEIHSSEGFAGASDASHALRSYAYERAREIFASLRDGQAIPKRNDEITASLQTYLPDSADEAVRLIDRLAMGAATEAYADERAEIALETEFSNQLDRILSGFEIDPAASQHHKPARPRIFQSELWQVLHKIRESAELSYAREIDLVELDRRILFLLKRGPVVPAGISSAVGVDKAQVSRSVKRLLELRMVERTQIRSPVSLTRKGEALADRLLRLAELRNRELSFDISDAELKEFFGVTEILLERAVALYEQERELAARAGRSDTDREPTYATESRTGGDAIVIERSRIASPLLTLSAYFSRSGALAMKRKTGLSNFEAWVLSEIGIEPPTAWSRLVKALERDHSQAGRTVNNLIERGLVVREGRPGRRHGTFSPTEEGRRLHKIITETGEQRSDFLLAQIPPDKQEAFLATFDKLRRNAAAQLERERAFEELEIE